MLYFGSDYQEGAHEKVLEALVRTNLVSSPGYGTDSYSEEAREKIRTACQCQEADVFFLVGGTQTNATVIDAVLRGYQGVIAADTGHIAVHEAGAIEFGGHKVMTLPHREGKISASQIASLVAAYEADDNRDHTVMPGMVYLSQPTEYGTLYSKAELTAISEVCRSHGLFLYVDGARLAYALAAKDNDVLLPDLAALTDAFYIGGTKCGLLFGEAVVIPVHNRIPHFFTTVKQHGALLAKGRLSGVQFGALFTDNLYFTLGRSAVDFASELREVLEKKGYVQPMKNTTNQVFVTLPDEQLRTLSEQVVYGFWEKADSTHTVIRLATSWATTREQMDQLLALL
ncbi:MAG: low specificity L-threonine aldolase [Clostridia bacterium]|nr:low specificity L-threonine aldolase [Clostridia bacterium]